MFERFTDRARHVVVLAQEEARMLNHTYIGTEHILLGLIHEGEDAGAKALESLGISLDAIRQQVEEITGQGQPPPPSGHIPFTPRAKKVLGLSLRESEQLGHDHVGTEHILLGLTREGDGVAAQVLVKLGADLNVVRQVIELNSGQQPRPGPLPPREGVPVAEVQAHLDAIEDRLAAVEQRVGTGPDTSDLDDQIDRVHLERHSAAAVQRHEQAASLRDREKELLASKTARRAQWAAGHPALPVLAERCQQLIDEMERLRALLRQHRMLPGAQIAVDLFHVVHLAVKMTGDVRRRVVRGKNGRRGRSGDPEYGIKNLLVRNLEHLSPAQFAKITGILQAAAAGQEVSAAPEVFAVCRDNAGGSRLLSACAWCRASRRTWRR